MAEWQIPYISEVTYGGDVTADFVEVAAEQEIDLSGWSVILYNSSGDVKATYALGDPVNVFAGHAAYVIDENDPGFADILSTDAIALVDDNGNVIQFLSFGQTVIEGTEGPATGMSSTPIGSAPNPASSLKTSDGGATYETSTSPEPGVVPCFALGTLIDTPDGEKPIETLQPGDLVQTLQGGAMPVLWIRQSTHPLDGPEDKGRPILISAGALGPGRPQLDLIVSPQHRVLVGGKAQLHSVFEGPRLVPAKALTGLPGIREMRGRKSITWVHFACKPHQAIRSNGCWTESLFLGTMVINGLNGSELAEIERIFAPPGADDWNGPLALPVIPVTPARDIIRAWRKVQRRAARGDDAAPCRVLAPVEHRIS